MTITEIKQALGSWEVRLREGTPKEILEKLTFYGHIAVTPGRVDVRQHGDNLLGKARYVGVLRGRDSRNDLVLRGSGMAFWLGDEDDKGYVIEDSVNFDDPGVSFAEAIRALLPVSAGVGPILEGTLHSVPGLYVGRHRWQTSRKAITYVCDTMGAEWRVNGDGTLDAGTIEQLYVTDPKALIHYKGPLSEFDRIALSGRADMEIDVEDHTTRVVLLAEGEGDSIATGEATLPSTPYKDIHGNPINITRLVSESGTSQENANLRAQLQLNRFTNPRYKVDLSTKDYDVKGSFVVGDYIYVFDPVNGFIDPQNEIYWSGDRIFPVRMRCLEMTWPVPPGWTVAFRTTEGEWLDLTPYYAPETGETTIVVGDFPHNLISGGEPIGPRPNLPSPDRTVPGQPVISQISSSVYWPDDNSWTKAGVTLSWTEPLNIDGSTITDGSHYEVQYSIVRFVGYNVRWPELEPYRWGELAGNRWGAPLTEGIPPVRWGELEPYRWGELTGNLWGLPLGPSEGGGGGGGGVVEELTWREGAIVPWGSNSTTVLDLEPGVEYRFRVRAVDATPNYGGWSETATVTTTRDITAPQEPAAPIVAASPIAVQVIHLLGTASGGSFNLDPDLHHFDVHLGNDPGFVPTDENLIGQLPANISMIQGQIPAVGTFPVKEAGEVWIRVIAVDIIGNKSIPSEAASASAQLIDDQFISNLSVSKLTAGTMTASMILGGSIKTGESGARVEMDRDGLRAYDPEGKITVDIDSATGSATLTGTIQSDNFNVDEDGAVTGFQLNRDGTGILTSVVIGGDNWGVNPEGNASFADLTVNANDVLIGGELLKGKTIENLPKGIRVYGILEEGDSPATPDGSPVEIPVFELGCELQNNRMYRLATSSMPLTASGSPLPIIANFKFRDGGASTPGVTSDLLQSAGTPITSTAAGAASARLEHIFQCRNDLPESFNVRAPGTHRFLLTMQAVNASNTASFKVDTSAGTDSPLTVYLEDLGALVEATGYERKLYTKEYNAVWSATYDGYDGIRVLHDGERQRQGGLSIGFPSDWGNMTSLIGFNYPAIQEDLAGASIIKIEFFVYFHYWFYFMGTAVIGTARANTVTDNGPPDLSTVTLNSNRIRVANWNEDEGRWVNLPVEIGYEFQSGATDCIAMGPGPRDDLEYYGKYHGDDMKYEPKLRITYRK